MERKTFFSRKEFEELVQGYSSAGVLIINEKNTKVLLGNHKESSDLWGNFGGGRQEGENPRKTAARELREETGLEISEETLGAPLIVTDSNIRQSIWTVFLLQIKEEVAATIKVPDSSEILSLRWFGWGDLMNLFDNVDFELSAEKLWGGRRAYAVLNRWIKTAQDNLPLSSFGGDIISPPFNIMQETLYEKIKREETKNH